MVAQKKGKMQQVRYECAPCSRFFGSSEALESHWVNSNRHVWCRRCDRHFVSIQAAESHWANSKEHWICEGCELDFWSEEDRLDHFKTSPKHHVCGICEDHFSTAAKLHQHSLTHVSKDIECWGCPKLFTGYSSMLAHLESELCATTHVRMDELAAEHALSDYYVIPGCSKYLRTGSRKKSQSKPIYNRSTKSFGCNKCDRTFPTDEMMAAHIASIAHHPLAFKCPGCQAQTATLSALVAHIEAKTCSEGISYGTGSVGELLRHLWENIRC